MNRILLLILLVGPLLTRSQEFAHRQYTVKDGLPGSIVYHALQDNNGFIWFATNQGVSRFDGSTFRNFSKKDGLPDNEILKLYLDRYHNLWCISFVGTPAVYYQGTFHRLNDCKGVFAVVDDFMTDSIFLISVYEKEKEGKTHYGYYCSASLTGQWQFHEYSSEPDKGCDNMLIPKVSSPKKINFYFSGVISHNYLARVRHADSICDFTFNKHPNLIFPFNRQLLFCLMPNQSSLLFYADSLYLLDDSRVANGGRLEALSSMKKFHPGTIDLNAIFVENDSTLWLCTRNRGLLRVKNFQRPDRVIQSFFPGMFCTSILKDHEGGYWVTTHNEGVYYLPNLSAFYLDGAGSRAIKDAKCIRAVGQGKLVAGLADGNILLVNGARWKAHFHDHHGTVKKNNRVLDIWPYRRHQFLVASDYGLSVVSPNGREKSFGFPPSGLKGVFPASDTSVFFADVMGIRRLNPLNNHLEYIYIHRSTCITGACQQYFWGTLKGMYTRVNDSTRYLGKQYPLLSGIINHIDVAPDSAIWVSTQQGIVILRHEQVFAIQQQQGLVSDMCKHVSFRGNVAWISTDKGISRVTYRWNGNIPMYTISNITEEDGLLSNDVNQTALSGGYIWAATGSGISYFTADYTPHSMQRPLININAITEGVVQKTVADTVLLDYKKNKLLIELSGISYRSGKQIYYQYRLQDLDSNWTNTANHLLEFYTLPFGTHIFEVKAVDRWGIKSERAKTLVIIVSPPFWKTGWFIFLTYFFTAVLIGGLAFLYFYRRQRQKEREFGLKKRMTELELMALRAQMNPHFIFNCLSSIQHYILRADINNANLYLHKFSTLVRMILQHSTTSGIALEEELKILSLYLELEKLRLGERLHYSIEVSNRLHPMQLCIPFMIIQPYLENAIKHGIAPLEDETGMVHIHFDQADNYLTCTIDDNGIGIRASAQQGKTGHPEHRSLGISITQSRINVLNALQKDKIRLEVTDKKEAGAGGQGTIVRVHFPIITE